MSVQDNSPTRKCIRWSDVKIVREGFMYPVKDGFTDKRCVYWTIDNPYELCVSDGIPSLYDEIVMFNENGVSTLYPSTNIIIDGNSIIDGNIAILEHMSNKTYHMSKVEKDMFERYYGIISDLETKVRVLGDLVTDLQSRVSTLEGR